MRTGRPCIYDNGVTEPGFKAIPAVALNVSMTRLNKGQLKVSRIYTISTVLLPTDTHSDHRFKTMLQSRQWFTIPGAVYFIYLLWESSYS